MKLYLIGGLGADERVFKYLNLNTHTEIIQWIDPKPKEGLDSYAKRLLAQINSEEEFGILGVSFGGIVALEISKHLKPNKVILISSVETNDQLPKIYLTIGKSGILNIIPNSLIKPPNLILSFLFGAKNTELLKEIIRDTKPAFIRWSLNSIVNWTNDSNTIETIRIHGTNDKLIPLKGKAIKVKDGGHFMIADKAEEISKLVNKYLNLDTSDS